MITLLQAETCSWIFWMTYSWVRRKYVGVLLLLCRGQLKCDGTRAETRFSLSTKRTSPFKSARASVHSATGSRGVRISSSNAGYTMLRGSVKGTGYPLHSPVSPSLPLSCITVCHHISTGVYTTRWTPQIVWPSKVKELRFFHTSGTICPAAHRNITEAESSSQSVPWMPILFLSSYLRLSASRGFVLSGVEILHCTDCLNCCSC